MNAIVGSYNALTRDPEVRRELWRQVAFRNGEVKDLSDIRLEFAAYTSAISMRLYHLSLLSQGVVEKQLRSLEGGTITPQMAVEHRKGIVITRYSEGDQQIWRVLHHKAVIRKRYTELIQDRAKELAERDVLDDTNDGNTYMGPTINAIPPSNAEETVSRRPRRGRAPTFESVSPTAPHENGTTREDTNTVTILDFEIESNPELACPVCARISILWVTIALASLTVGLWRSFATGDEGKGFTDAAYVVAVGGLVVYPVQTRHSERCRRRVPGVPRGRPRSG